MFFGDKIALMVILALTLSMIGIVFRDGSVTGLSIKEIFTSRNEKINYKEGMFSFTIILLIFTILLTISTYFFLDKIT